MPRQPTPPTRLLGALACALLLALLAGCGGDEQEAAPSGVRVRILTSEVDGPVQGRLQLRALEEGDDKLYDLEPVEGEAHLYECRDAPPAMYGLASTEGWGMLWAGTTSSAPRLRGPDYPATLVRMGKPRSLYIGNANPQLWQVSARWGVELKPAGAGGDVPFERVPIEVHMHPDGLAAFQLSPEHWRGGMALRVVGLMEGGVPTRVIAFTLGNTPFVHLPRMALVDPAPQATFQVYLVPTPGLDQVPDGTPVRIDALGLPLDLTTEVKSKDGLARFDGLAALGGPLRVSLPQSGEHAVYEITAEQRRLQGAMWIVATPPDAPTVWVGGDELAPEVVEARVLHAGGDAFGRVPLVRVGAEGGGKPRIELATAQGDQEWALRRADGRWSHAQVHVPGPETQPPVTRIHPVAQGEACQVRGRVTGALPGSRVAFRLLVEARARLTGPVIRERLVGGGGFVAAVSPQGEYAATLPPGTWEIRVVAPSGAGSEPRTMPLEPGTHMRMDLTAR